MTYPNTDQRIASWVSAEEFGAIGDGVTDDSGHLQAAIDFAITNAVKLYLLPSKSYLITTSLTVPVYNDKQNLFLDGNNSTIIMAGGDFAFKITPAVNGANGLPHFRDLIIAGSSASGFDVGGNSDSSATKFMYSNARGPIFYNVMTLQIGGIALRIQNAAHFDVDKFVARNDNPTGDGLIIIAGSAGFTGDITFNDCQFQSQADNHYAAYLNSYATYGSQYATQLRGVRFNSCVFYGGQTFLGCSTKGLTADIWFNNCAWDSNNRPIAVTVDVNQDGQLNKVIFSNAYMVGYDRGFVLSKVTTQSSVANIKFESCMIGETKEPIYLVGMSGFDIQNCTFDGCSASYSLINVDRDCQKFKISDNMEIGCTGSFMIAIGGPDTARFSCINNVCYDIAAVLNDTTGSVSKQTCNNVKL